MTRTKQTEFPPLQSGGAVNDLQLFFEPWISKDAYADLTGLTTGTIEGWMQKHWTRDIQYKVIGRTTLVNRVRAAEWIELFDLDKGGECLQKNSPRATRTRKLTCPQH